MEIEIQEQLQAPCVMCNNTNNIGASVESPPGMLPATGACCGRNWHRLVSQAWGNPLWWLLWAFRRTELSRESSSHWSTCWVTLSLSNSHRESRLEWVQKWNIFPPFFKNRPLSSSQKIFSRFYHRSPCSFWYFHGNRLFFKFVFPTKFWFWFYFVICWYLYAITSKHQVRKMWRIKL